MLPSTTIPAERNGATAAPPSAAAPYSSIGSAQGTAAGPDAVGPDHQRRPQSAPPAGQSTKIAQTGSLDLQVPKGALTSTITALTTLATRAQGFVANTQTRAHPGERGTSPQGSVTLEVPEASFGTVLHEAQGPQRASTSP